MKNSMKTAARKAQFRSVAFGTCIIAAGHFSALSSSADDKNIPADNSARNTQDARFKLATPLDQSNKQEDIDVSASIRKAIVGSDKFSQYADNIKIITTENRKITLRGPVTSAKESSEIADIARRAAPNYEVINLLNVAK